MFFFYIFKKNIALSVIPKPATGSSGRDALESGVFWKKKGWNNIFWAPEVGKYESDVSEKKMKKTKQNILVIFFNKRPRIRTQLDESCP